MACFAGRFIPSGTSCWPGPLDTPRSTVELLSASAPAFGSCVTTKPGFTLDSTPWDLTLKPAFSSTVAARVTRSPTTLGTGASDDANGLAKTTNATAASASSAAANHGQRGPRGGSSPGGTG